MIPDKSRRYGASGDSVNSTSEDPPTILLCLRMFDYHLALAKKAQQFICRNLLADYVQRKLENGGIDPKKYNNDRKIHVYINMY